MPAAAAGFALPGVRDAGMTWAVTDEGRGIAASVCTAMERCGMRAVVIDSLPESLPDSCQGLLLLDGLRSFRDPAAAMRIQRRAFRLARRMAERLEADKGCFITVQDTGGDFGLSGRAGERAWLAGFSGLAKTAALEWPLATVKAIDIETGESTVEQIAERLVGELVAGGPEMEVGLTADGGRWTLIAEEASLVASGERTEPLAAAAVHDGSVLIVSGGARGVTAEALLELAQHRKPKVALLGRSRLFEEPDTYSGLLGETELRQAIVAECRSRGETPTPKDVQRLAQEILANREAQHTIRRLEAAGLTVRYLAVDVRDADALRDKLQDVRNEWGPITGIVHGAGVLADKRLRDKTDEQFDRVFLTKVAGLAALLQATQDDPLACLVLFSSIAARTGNIGQCDYAMANEVLNKVAAAEAHRRGTACLVKALNWGPWDGGMVNPLLKRHFAERGIALIPPKEGATQMVAELEAAGSEGEEFVIAGRSEGGTGWEPAFRSSMDIVVHRSTHDFLTDHSLGVVPVLPVVQALDWFIRMAAACRPELQVVACEDLRVLKGAELHRFETDGDRFEMVCEASEEEKLAPSEPGMSSGWCRRLQLALRGVDGTIHYRCTVLLEPALAIEPTLAPNREPSPAQEPLQAAESLYSSGLLFHGPRFQAIHAITGVEAGGASAILDGTAEADLLDPAQRIDLRSMDGGLQLALVWGHEQAGFLSLPTRIGRFAVREGRSWPDGPIHVQLNGEVGKRKTVSRIVFYSGQGEWLAELDEVEMHAIGRSTWGTRSLEGGA